MRRNHSSDGRARVASFVFEPSHLRKPESQGATELKEWVAKSDPESSFASSKHDGSAPHGHPQQNGETVGQGSRVDIPNRSLRRTQSALKTSMIQKMTGVLESHTDLSRVELAWIEAPSRYYY